MKNEKNIFFISTYRHVFLGRDGKGNLLLTMSKCPSLRHSPTCNSYHALQNFWAVEKQKAQIEGEFRNFLPFDMLPFQATFTAENLGFACLLLWGFDEEALACENIFTGCPNTLNFRQQEEQRNVKLSSSSQ